MATFLDLSLLGFFGSIFMFIFVFALVWGLLSFFKLFKGVPGENGIYGLIALAMALFATVSKTTTTLIATLAPWFTVMIVFLFLLFIVFRMFSGEDGSQIKDAITKPGIYWTIIVLGIIILIGSLSNTFGQDLLEDQVGPTSNIDDNNEINDDADSQDIDVSGDSSTNTNSNTNTGSSSGQTATTGTGSTATDDFSNNVLATIINPKVMGLIMLMLIAFFTILLIARTPDPDA